MAEENVFRKFWNAGYRRLVPVVPPGAPLSPHSHLIRKPENIGKVPGIKGRDGLWRSFGWTSCESTEEDLDVWHAMGAGVGIRTGQGLAGIDVDISDPGRLERLKPVLEQYGLLKAAYRVGQKPRFLMPVRIVSDFRSTPPGTFDAGDRLEILYEGRYFVAHGIHPTTKSPYTWPRGIPNAHDLPSFV